MHPRAHCLTGTSAICTDLRGTCPIGKFLVELCDPSKMRRGLAIWVALLVTSVGLVQTGLADKNY